MQLIFIFQVISAMEKSITISLQNKEKKAWNDRLGEIFVGEMFCVQESCSQCTGLKVTLSQNK